MAHDELETTIEELAVVLDAQKDAAAQAHTQVQHTLAELRELVTLVREYQRVPSPGDETLRHRINDLDRTLRRFTWKMLTIGGSLLLGACVICSVLSMTRVKAEARHARLYVRQYTAIALGLDHYLTTTLYAQLSAEQRTAIDTIYAKAHSVSPGQR